MSKDKNKEFLEHFVETPQVETQESEADRPAEDQEVVDRKRNWALLRYIAIMFGVAFILVFMSLYFTTRRSSQQTISQLSQNANSALARAEQLQNDNRELTETNTELQQAVTRLEKELATEQEKTTGQEGIIETLASEKQELLKEKEDLTKEKENMQKAYSLLAQAQLASAGQNWEDCATALHTLESLQEYLDKDSQTIYDQLQKELETNQEN